MASTLAARLGASPLVVRLAFAVLGLAGGMGVLLYGVLWVILPRDPSPPAAGHPESTHPASPRRERTRRELTLRHDLGVVAAAAAALVVMVELVPSLPEELLWPVGFVAFALAFSARSSFGADMGTGLVMGRILIGVTLMLGGLFAGFAVMGDYGDVWVVAAAAFAVMLGVALVLAPWLRALVESADTDRRERIRAEERSDLAAHLHDSVLQTLTLIQNRASEPQVAAALAHQQERELRRWLYANTGEAAADESSVRTSLTAVAAEVEDQYLIVVECIVVGDTAMTPNSTALVAATREALVNAAKFSNSQLVSLYAEINDDRVLAFVRDRGTGFDPESVPADRRGIADSIHRRVERAGGTAQVRSTSGVGTEIRIDIPT